MFQPTIYEYTFGTADLEKVTVQATSEQAARTKVMEQRWGRPTAIYANRGDGLFLMEEKVVAEPCRD